MVTKIHIHKKETVYSPYVPQQQLIASLMYLVVLTRPDRFRGKLFKPNATWYLQQT